MNLNSVRESHVHGIPDTNNYLSNDNITLVKDSDRLSFAHLNANSVRNLFGLLTDIVENNIDILMISETKFYLSFPKGQF